jgi:hypothetical protein
MVFGGVVFVEGVDEDSGHQAGEDQGDETGYKPKDADAAFVYLGE